MHRDHALDATCIPSYQSVSLLTLKDLILNRLSSFLTFLPLTTMFQLKLGILYVTGGRHKSDPSALPRGRGYTQTEAEREEQNAWCQISNSIFNCILNITITIVSLMCFNRINHLINNVVTIINALCAPKPQLGKQNISNTCLL